jgi:hypothetical protein
MDDDDFNDLIEQEIIFTEILIVTFVQVIFIHYVENNFSSIPMRTSPLSGAAYVFELLDCGNDRRIKETATHDKKFL